MSFLFRSSVEGEEGGEAVPASHRPMNWNAYSKEDYE